MNIAFYDGMLLQVAIHNNKATVISKQEIGAGAINFYNYFAKHRLSYKEPILNLSNCSKRQTNYAALAAAIFGEMKVHPNATFRIPYGLGCGLAGGNWVTVLDLIEEAANAWNANVEIWVLPKK